MNFGTKDTVEFAVFGRKPELKNSCIEHMYYVPNSDQKALKNPEVSPWTLLGFKENISLVISSTVGIRRIELDCC